MSTTFSNDDKRIVDDALSFTKEQNHSVSTLRTEFEEKGWFGLWWDAKGLLNSLDKHDVLKSMDMYKEIYENIVTSLTLIENGDEESYQELLRLYAKLEKMEMSAKENVNNKSKTLCQVAHDFLDKHCKLDHKLKRVECVVLTKNIVKVKDLAENLGEMLSVSIKNLNTLSSDNHNLKDSLDVLHGENQVLKDTMTTILEENQELRNTIAESNERAERRFQEMMEENQRNMERMLIALKQNKSNDDK